VNEQAITNGVRRVLRSYRVDACNRAGPFATKSGPTLYCVFYGGRRLTSPVESRKTAVEMMENLIVTDMLDLFSEYAA
jgi:hypothetical protein